MRRITYFLATNFAVMIVFSIIIAVVMPFLPPELRTDNFVFLIFAVLFGMGGSLFSLLMSILCF